MKAGIGRLAGIEELRQRKDMFDNTWMLSIVLSVSSIAVFWYLGLGQIDLAPIVWTLAGLALAQYFASAGLEKSASTRLLKIGAMGSQLGGICAMGVAWHLFGGLQQPMFPIFIMLPLFTGALILSFWQQQVSILLFLGVLLSGVLLSPDTNSFIEERYGLGMLATHALPAWIPRSRVAFADVSTSPTYNFMLTGSLGILAVALSATSRALVALSWRLLDRVHTLQDEVEDTRHLNAHLIAGAPGLEVLVTLNTGRILDASARFVEAFAVTGPAGGQFLLDTIAFAYPVVIKRLMTVGGEEIQGASVGGRDVVLRVTAGVIDSEKSPMVRMRMESCDELCWRGALDALEQPVFAISTRGSVLFLNRSAGAIFGADAENADAASLFDAGPGSSRWWDIGPLGSARRVLYRHGRKYLATIRRDRIAESIGELSFIHLYEHEAAHAVAEA